MCSTSEVQALPIMVVRCQDEGGGGVSVAGDPGAVHSEEGQHQHEEEVDHGASVEDVLHPTSRRARWLLLGRSWLWVSHSWLLFGRLLEVEGRRREWDKGGGEEGE